MWWSDRRAFLGALAAPALLAACGFTPLYDPGAPASRMAGRVEVPVIEGAPGFVLREELTARLGPAEAAAYRLDVKLKLTTMGVALTQQNETTRFDVIGTAEYTLVPIKGGTPVASGVVRQTNGYNAPNSDTSVAFAALSAERDAERRLAVNLADQILQRLALSAESWT